MWIVGTIVLFAIGVAAIVAIGWSPRATPSPPLWDIPSLSQIYTGIVGTLGGFAVASAIFIAGLDAARTSPAFATVIGMLLIAFLILVFSALEYASIPNLPAAGDDAVFQSFTHALANMCGCLGLSISWLALIPLLDLLGLPVLARAFTWVLLLLALGASGWVAMFAYRLTTASARACLAIPLAGFGLAALYRLVAVSLWPALWPASDAALHYAFVALAVVGLLFACHVNLLLLYGNETVRQRLWCDGHAIVLGFSAAYALAQGFAWFAVAMP
ncbi:MAG: hypothetical protein ACRDJC_05695 [Thermomicrobiales bacterium]